ncbi:flagellar protein FliS [Povalibacter uvarum]|uniref:Flagellar secretion chaperone FliS n=1 Tax=Povalibacter uvarum TaxID=732238 RepID=A0A841HPE1_9GAMM|nr:flagellar export chaperone FliS [Povalibacter uvarum]MBB6094209.1 flagellar protein FliS [Povalibacter uvarum]
MNAYARTSNLAAYQSAAAHGGVAASDPHRLIVMLMDGALERIATARGCMQRGETAEKARLLNRSVQIVAELRGSLDLSAGGQIAANLSELYDYMSRRLLSALANNQVELLDEVSKLLNDIRSAWVAIPAQAQKRPGTP